jgi:hypothetical protein
MSKTIQLRHVPDDLHRKLKARVALAGLPLSAYRLEEVRRMAERPMISELKSRLARRHRVTPAISPALALASALEDEEIVRKVLGRKPHRRSRFPHIVLSRTGRLSNSQVP